ncbi:transferrin-binding protein-like solute binding protein [Sphingomonas sp. Tas61C01]|uniref:transferrin-binding protein-like solute binding protein n=1 Tax=Sphingomonas sp. Tas61C01 TaxID=3458297 RepID=UPI00403E9EA2
MRATLAILSLPLLSLAACGGSGGGGTQSLGTIAPPIAGGTVSGGGVVSVAPTPTPTSTPTSFLDVKTTTTFDAIGALHAIDVTDKGASLYTGNASTVGTPSGTITFNPRDGIFTVALADTAAGVTRNVNYQDPAHRTDIGFVQSEIPDLPSFNYLEAASSDSLADTFFYKRPGNTASFVTLAGFTHRSKLDAATGAFHSERGVMVFGSKSTLLQIPSTGSGHFDGDFLATMIAGGATASVSLPLQWISGTSSVDVDFGKSTLALGLTGTVGKTFVNNSPVNDFFSDIPTGAVFTANGTASLTGSRTSFAGKFTNAYFTSGATRTNIDFAPISAASSVAGASSIDGAFYGPGAENVGGNFRITGGVPDQRIDILGAFTGAKK